MTTLQLEFGEEQQGIACEHCGQLTTTVHGFVYSAAVPLAMYYAGWSDCHSAPEITLAIATGEWGEGSVSANRVSMGFLVRSRGAQLTFTALDPDDTPWGETPLFGKMLSRSSALNHGVWAQTISAVEFIVQEDPRIWAHISQTV